MAARRNTNTTIALVSGGTLTLGLNVDLFTLGETDRVFVLDLVDRVAQYARANPVPAPSASIPSEPKAEGDKAVKS